MTIEMENLSDGEPRQDLKRSQPHQDTLTPREALTKKLKQETSTQAETAQTSHSSDPVETSSEPLPETSESTDMNRFILRLFNLHNHIREKQISQKLTSLSLPFEKIKKQSKASANIIFASQTNAETALAALKNDCRSFGKRVDMRIVAEKEELERQERTRGDRRQGVDKIKKGKEFDPNDTRTPKERLSDQVTPLWRKPYDEQLVMKRGLVEEAFRLFKNNLFKCMDNKDWRRKPKNNEDTKEEAKVEPVRVSDLSEEELDVTLKDMEKVLSLNAEDRAQYQLAWMKRATKSEASPGMPLPIPDVTPSPILSAYRTKNEFSIGKNVNGEPTVGFLLGAFKDGVVCVEDASDCIHISQEAKDIACIVQTYIRENLELAPYDRVEKTGFWRLVLVRTQSTGENLVIIQANADQSPSEQVTQQAKKGVMEALLAKGNLVSTLLFQHSDEVFNGFKFEKGFEILHGSGVVHEELLGINFQISPSSFFQVNKPATEILYTKIKDLALSAYSPEESKNVVLLDLCCGTGTIGIALAQYFKKVIGIEMVPEAVKDAEENAKRNGIENITFLCGKVENHIKDVFRSHVAPNDIVVAILDPPRNGVHSSVSTTIRGCAELKHVVYVACDAKQAQTNWVELCRPTSKSFTGFPFVPVSAFAVDMFPHTNHVETIMYLTRH